MDVRDSDVNLKTGDSHTVRWGQRILDLGYIIAF